MTKIALIGMMGSGKTSIAKELSQISGLKIIDLDEYIEKSLNQTINQIFETKGEDFFRKKEQEFLKKIIAENDNFILSTGGGTFINKKNREIIKNQTTSFWLKATSATIWQRIKDEKTRPLLGNDFNQEKIEKILSKREEFYNLSDYIIDTEQKNIAEISQEIWKKLN